MVKVTGLAESTSEDLFQTDSSEASLGDLFGETTGEESTIAVDAIEAEEETPEPETVEAVPGAHIQLAGCENVHIHVNPPAEASPAPAASHDDGKAAPVPEPTPEQKFERDVAYAKERFTNASMHVSELESQVKSLKSDLKDARETMEEAYDSLIELQERGPEQPKPTASLSSGSTEAESQSSNSESPNPAPAEKPEDNAWRNEPLTALELDKIDGLGKKKLEALMDAVPTIGAFEDLRAQAGAYGVHTLLPKGLGRKIADELEERQIAWLQRRWAKSMVASQVPLEPESFVDHQTAVDEPQTEEPTADEPQIDEGNPVGEHLPFGLPPRTVIEGEDKETQVRRRLNELAEATTNPSAPDIDTFRKGKAAASHGSFVTDCELDAGDDQDSWLLGFISGGDKE